MTEVNTADTQDLQNLVVHFEKQELTKLGQLCWDAYQEDNNSRQPWLDKHKEYLEIYHQQESYNNNFNNSFHNSAARIPLLTESCLGFQARAYKAIFPQRSFVATTSMADINPQEMERAERVAKWMNYLLNFRIRRYKRDKKRMLLSAALMGSDFSKVYYDPIARMPKVERVRAQDFVVSYGTGPRELEDVKRKTQIITMDINRAKQLYQIGFFASMPLERENNPNDSEMTNVELKAEGISQGSSNTQVCLILEQHTFYDLDGDGIEEPVIIWIDDDTKKILRLTARFDINDEKKTPIEYFTHYQFIDNADGFYGYGYGHLIANLNIALNQMLRNSIDAGELANAGNMGGFISDNVGIKGGEIEFPIGKFTKIPRTADDLQKAIYQMRFPGPNGSYVTLMEYLQSTIQRLANTTEAVSGDVSKVYQPMTILTMLEQSLQLPTSIMENIALSMEGELDKIFKVGAENAQLIDSFILDNEKIGITAEDFKIATRIYPIMDPRSITKQQKMAKAQSIYQLAMGNPLIAQDPASMYNVTKQVLESMEVTNIDGILKKPGNQEPERIDDQHTENMFFLLPPQDRPFFDVFPEQDHQTHLAILNELLQGFEQQQAATGKMDISEDSLQALMLHKQKHVAYLYGQKHGVINGPGQLGAMEETSGNEALLAALANELQLGGQSVNLPSGEGGILPGTGGGFEGSGELPGEGLLERVPLDARNTNVRQ